MTKLDVPYLVVHQNQDETKRFYFAPRQVDRRHGWATVRLHDQYQQPIRDAGQAATACSAIADIYRRWRAGEEGYGPHRIDKLGRVVQLDELQANKLGRKIRNAKLYKPGQIGAMVADYKDHTIFQELSAKTRAEYETYLGLFVEKFGDSYWRKLAPGTVRVWLKERAKTGGPAGAHALYRTARAFFGKVRLVYQSVDHPGYVPASANPLESLDLGLPKSTILIWPREAVQAFIALCDELGQPSIGDAMLAASWLGVRRQDWLAWPADIFDRPLIAFRQEKTDVPNVLPWDLVPELVARVAEAKRRRTADAVASTTFFHDAAGKPWGKPARFRAAFNAVRDVFAQRHPSFPTRYFVGLVAGDPLAVPTAELTMRTMRHTCVTLNFDAGVPPHLIGGITGHSQQEIDDILRHYRARTADQAQAAIEARLAHEAKKGSA